METPTDVKFDLLELTWWQQPWYIAAVCGALLCIIAAAVAWYFWKRRPATAHALFLQRLARAAALPATTHTEQKKICDLVTGALKEYSAVLTTTPVRHVRGLTDQELVPFLYARHAPDTFVRAVEPFIATGCTVKFAQGIISPQELELSLMTIQTIVTTLPEQKQSQRPS